MALAAAVVVAAALLRSPPAAASGGWQRPVPGPIARAFDYAGEPFTAGRHRGVDFAAAPGRPVRSACSGEVVFAGTAGSNGPTVSVRCGPWRVVYLPLHSIAVRSGTHVARGARLGAAAGVGRHAGLHVGVRRDGRRWAYIDPMLFFGGRAPAVPPIGPPPRALRRPPTGEPVTLPHPPALAPHARPLPHLPTTASHARPLPHLPATASHVRPRPHAPAAESHAAPAADRRAPPSAPRVARPPAPARARPLAPWPAWAGLALVLAGASGAGVSRRHRRRADRVRAARTARASA